MNAMGIELQAAGSVVAQVGPTFAANRGFTSVSRTSAGVYVLTLDQGLSADAASINCTARATLAASGLVAFGVTHTSATVKTVTILQEGAAGAASALADVNFDINVLRLTP